MKKCPSMKIIEIADVISSDANKETIGIRPGEKLHEQITGHEMLHIPMNMIIIIKFFRQYIVE